MKISRLLYNLTRKLGKASSIANDLETISTGDCNKIVKRFARKSIFKKSNKIAKIINSKIK